MHLSPFTKGKKNIAVKVMERMTTLSYPTLIGIWASMAVIFALMYFGLSFIGEGQHGPSQLHDMTVWHRFYNSLYYSIITATSTGYGDITPHGISKIIASLQSISALFVFAIFVTKLVSHRQEITLTEVHRLTFEDMFHNTREGLYICRKDFDNIIHHARGNTSISSEDWENLTIAYRHLQTLLEEIPDFYENDIHNYTIDKKREALLLEAVHRTLHRLNLMLDTLSVHNVDWTAYHEGMEELEEVVHIIERVTDTWSIRSPYGMHEAFEDILMMKDRMRLKLLQTVT